MEANVATGIDTAKLEENYRNRFKPRESDWQFRNDETEADEYHLAEFLQVDKVKNEFGSNTSHFTVDVELQPEMRAHCIKSISPVIIRVTGSVFWNSTDENEKYTEGEIVIDTLTTHADWTIENELKFEEDGGFYISNVEIDFKTKTITVTN